MKASKLLSTQPASVVPKRPHDIARLISSAHRGQYDSNFMVKSTDRRFILESLASIGALTLIPAKAVLADDFKVSESGLKYLDLKEGSGQEPKPGSRCVVHWAGYTEGYQGKRFGNSSLKDEPFEFVLGKHTAIPAFEEAVAGMKVGGIRRIIIPPELAYVDGVEDGKPGPVPSGFGPKQRIRRVMILLKDIPGESLLLDVKATRVQ